MVFKRDQELQAAINSGWTISELQWERLQEKGNVGLEKGGYVGAAVYFLLARILAELHFPRSDLRFLTSQANIAWVLDRSGFSTMARRRYTRLVTQWQTLGTFGYNELEIKPRARSSLFHVRMEALHWDQYRQNVTARLQLFADETRQCLERFAQGEDAPSRLFSRWKGEKYPVFDDTRKILGACLLVAGER